MRMRQIGYPELAFRVQEHATNLIEVVSRIRQKLLVD